MTATKGFSDDFFHTHCLETGDFFFSNVKLIKQSLLRLRDQGPVIKTVLPGLWICILVNNRQLTAVLQMIFSKKYFLKMDRNFSPI